MKYGAIAMLLAVAFLFSGVAVAEEFGIARGNEVNFGELLRRLMLAYESPAPGDAEAIEAAVAEIDAVNGEDGEVARAIADHWKAVYLDDYEMYFYDGGQRADALDAVGLEDSASHAIVVLGYELKDGEMTDELKGRCDAAAAVAAHWPSAIIVCSGGPTGKNNPDGHTEAGLMKDYLVKVHGVDAGRVFIDERAMTTLENAVNTFEILRAQGVATMTIVTSGYHQRWGQAVYNAMGAIYRQELGYGVDIVGNYSFEIEQPDKYRRDDRFAIRQIASMLKLPKEIVEEMDLKP